MGGEPYAIEAGKIQYNTEKLALLRLPGMTSADRSHAGIYVVDEDDTGYDAPISYNGRVEYNASQEVNPVLSTTLREVIERLLADPSFLAGIKTQVEDPQVDMEGNRYSNPRSPHRH